MRTLNLSMDEAYDRVKSHKPNIAPNFSFMGQLLDYERDLYGANIAKDQQPSTSSSATPSNKDQNVDDNFVINSLPESSATATCCWTFLFSRKPLKKVSMTYFCAFIDFKFCVSLILFWMIPMSGREISVKLL